MKKILSSLLALTMLFSSVAVLCSAEENVNSNITSTINETTLNSEKTCNLNSLYAKVKSLQKNLENNVSNSINNSVKFCKDHQKQLTITAITTAAVAVVASTVYIFRNEVKGLTKKVAKQVKKVFEKKQSKVLA